MLLVVFGAIFIVSCDTTTSDNFENSINLFTDLEPISGASNTTMQVNKGDAVGENAFFKINISGINAEGIIKDGVYQAWCIEWKKGMSSDNDTHSGVKLYSTNGSSKWKPLSYFFAIKKDLEIEDPSLTFREMQAVIWSLAGFIEVAPEFDLDKLSNDEIPSRLMKENGQPNFSKEKVKAIVNRVKSEYSTAKYRLVDTEPVMVLGETAEDEQDVIIPPVEDPGKDVVVYNDINIFDNVSMSNANNVLFVQNLVTFTTDGSRNTGDVVWMDRGRDGGNTNICFDNGECNDTGWGTMRSTITAEGMTIVDLFSESGDLSTIPSDVKVIFLIMPITPYTAAEINAFKQFADEGGRIVFVGEWEGFYPSAGIATENQFLLDMGAVLTNSGGSIDCGRQLLPGTSIVEHPITTGMTEFAFGCFSEIIPGPNDFVLMFGQNGTTVMGGVAEIDTTPIAVTKVVARSKAVRSSIPDDLDTNSGTGY